LEWEEEDRAKLVAWLVESGSKCPSCGTAEWEWEEDRYAYEPAVHQCWGCYLKELSSDDASGLAGGRIVLQPKNVASELRDKGSRPRTRV